MNHIKKIEVLYDERCLLCLRVAQRLRLEPSFVEMHVLPMRASVQRAAYTNLAPLVENGRFLVIADGKDVYIDTKARLLVMWALRRYRGYSYLLASPLLYWAIDLAFECIARNRYFLSAFLSKGATIMVQPMRKAVEPSTCGPLQCQREDETCPQEQLRPKNEPLTPVG